METSKWRLFRGTGRSQFGSTDLEAAARDTLQYRAEAGGQACLQSVSKTILDGWLSTRRRTRDVVCLVGDEVESQRRALELLFVRCRPQFPEPPLGVRPRLRPRRTDVVWTICAEQFLAAMKYFLSSGHFSRQELPSVKERLAKSAQELSHLWQVAWQDSTPVKLEEPQTSLVQKRVPSAFLQQLEWAQVSRHWFQPSFKKTSEAQEKQFSTQRFPVTQTGFNPSQASWHSWSLVNLVVLNRLQAASHLSMETWKVASFPWKPASQFGRQTWKPVAATTLQKGCTDSNSFESCPRTICTAG
ncbi:Hypothetical_protein [Hexamita inflata]|uniref:Hypothetical_protein n=1 Tax=Hexamita inflata TaxID=28002 RepID=A0AA86PH24_9EUKA|nr:Hypothetical protein HINF_LOCUS26869 [Hexamita inflata]